MRRNHITTLKNMPNLLRQISVWLLALQTLIRPTEQSSCLTKYCMEDCALVEEQLDCKEYDRQKLACNCCKTCKSNLDEKCQGWNNYFGDCRTGLKCIPIYEQTKDDPDSEPEWVGNMGVCKPMNFPDDKIIKTHDASCEGSYPPSAIDHPCAKWTCTGNGDWAKSVQVCAKKEEDCLREGKSYKIESGECCGKCVTPADEEIYYDISDEFDLDNNDRDTIPTFNPGRTCGAMPDVYFDDPCQQLVCRDNVWRVDQQTCEVSREDCILKGMKYSLKAGICCGECIYYDLPSINEILPKDDNVKDTDDYGSGSESTQPKTTTEELIKILIMVFIVAMIMCFLISPVMYCIYAKQRRVIHQTYNFGNVEPAVPTNIINIQSPNATVTETPSLPSKWERKPKSSHPIVNVTKKHKPSTHSLGLGMGNETCTSTPMTQKSTSSVNMPPNYSSLSSINYSKMMDRLDERDQRKEGYLSAHSRSTSYQAQPLLQGRHSRDSSDIGSAVTYQDNTYNQL